MSGFVREWRAGTGPADPDFSQLVARRWSRAEANIRQRLARAVFCNLIIPQLVARRHSPFFRRSTERVQVEQARRR
jgi:hypothetical protein